MRFALIDNKRVEAKFGLKGICPGCSQPVIAKCGSQRIHHWSHSHNKMYESRWEPETEWHRSWKNNFPDDWQEILLPDERTGEKHIADIRTSHGLVIEFQHSHIKSQERGSREKFHKNMIWVVDGTRLKLDYRRFLKGKEYFRLVKKGIYSVEFPEECFPASWLGSSVPVIFDFLDNVTISDPSTMRNCLYCLFPVLIDENAIIAEIPRIAFINTVISGEWLARVRHFLDVLNQIKQEKQDQKDQQQIQMANMIFEKFGGASHYRKNRRF